MLQIPGCEASLETVCLQHVLINLLDRIAASPLIPLPAFPLSSLLMSHWQLLQHAVAK